MPDEPARDDIQELLRTLHGAASELLAKQGGELYPIAAAVRADGEIELVGADPGGGEHPDVDEVSEMLLGALHEMAVSGEIVAAAVAVNMAGPAGDFLRYRVESRDDGPFFSDVPYEVDSDGEYDFLDGSAEPAPERRIFPRPGELPPPRERQRRGLFRRRRGPSP